MNDRFISFDGEFKYNAAARLALGAPYLTPQQNLRIVLRLYRYPREYKEEYSKYVDDIEHWKKLVTRVRAKRLVELGIGTGRVAIPLARDLGVHIMGIDASRHMTRFLKSEVARINRERQAHGHDPLDITVCEDDMSKFVVGSSSFDMVMIPLNTFFHLRWEDQQACVSYSAACLKPGGLLAINVFNIDEMVKAGAFFLQGNPFKDVLTVSHVSRDGRYRVKRYDCDVYSPEERVLHCNRRTEWETLRLDSKYRPERLKAFPLFISRPTEMADMLSKPPFQLDHELSSIRSQDKSHYWVARKAS